MQSERSSRALGVHSLDHFALCVPNLQAASTFYDAFGLELHPSGDHLGIHAHGHSQCWGLLIEDRVKRLHHLSFGVFEQDLEGFKQRMQKQGIQLLEPPRGLTGSGLWMRDPDGTLIELRVAHKTAPDHKRPAQVVSSPAGIAGAPKRSEAPQIRPSRLGHCLMFTRSVPAAVSFYSSVLGLRLSDRCADDIAFMHGIHGSDHHLVAFARSNAPGLHHCSWDVSSVHEIGLGAAQMASKGFSAGWGLGRHVLGSNYFHYVRDPWHSYAEYSCDMDYIPVNEPWAARDHAPEDAFYIWGPRPPDDWTCNHEAEQL